MTTGPADDLAAVVTAQLPYLRRFARALAGGQAAGDAYAAATLEALLADPGAFDRALPPRAALFKAFSASGRFSLISVMWSCVSTIRVL